ncbi:hypothetical protein H7K24_09515 [Mycobacterium fragae]|uniref:hypothetical protein n=1 Tax=Mycobacterium fragae TaxID=1260918 RepID=UPI00111C61CE|nr:hypothetical protein [Mycobacterium fragae]MCV7400393.1 hypothetical protein [Mycobacterium fragae]
MTQAPEPPLPPEAPPPPPPPRPPHEAKPPRLYQVAAWVMIVAGTVLILAIVFFTGAAVAMHDLRCSYHHGVSKPGGMPDGPPPGPGRWIFIAPGGPGAPPPMGPGGPPMPPGPPPPPAPPPAPPPPPPPPPR